MYAKYITSRFAPPKSATNYKPVKLQNGVGPAHCIVSASYKCSERQYSDVLSVYAIRTNAAEEQNTFKRRVVKCAA